MRILLSALLALFYYPAYAADFELHSNAFKQNEAIPAIYTCDGENISPELHWSPVPANTQALAIIFSGPDWPQGTVYKWVIYNLPKDTKSLPKGANLALPEGTLSGINFGDDKIYRGPCAPDSNLHHYVFTIYALDQPLDLSDGAQPEDVIAKMQNHILKQAELMGTYIH